MLWYTIKFSQASDGYALIFTLKKQLNVFRLNLSFEWSHLVKSKRLIHLMWFRRRKNIIERLSVRTAFAKITFGVGINII